MITYKKETPTCGIVGETLYAILNRRWYSGKVKSFNDGLVVLEFDHGDFMYMFDIRWTLRIIKGAP